jgi:hypothetical protein
MTSLAPVIEVIVASDSDAARRAIVGALADLPTGTLVRLNVGKNLPPMWASHSLRGDLIYQPVATSIRAAHEWFYVLGGHS